MAISEEDQKRGEEVAKLLKDLLGERDDLRTQLAAVQAENERLQRRNDERMGVNEDLRREVQVLRDVLEIALAAGKDGTFADCVDAIEAALKEVGADDV